MQELTGPPPWPGIMQLLIRFRAGNIAAAVPQIRTGGADPAFGQDQHCPAAWNAGCTGAGVTGELRRAVQQESTAKYPGRRRILTDALGRRPAVRYLGGRGAAAWPRNSLLSGSLHDRVMLVPLRDSGAELLQPDHLVPQRRRERAGQKCIRFFAALTQMFVFGPPQPAASTNALSARILLHVRPDYRCPE